ncbi:MAG TPA: YIP1 family protein [Terriglobales bacterium]|nr:YIP1 family protein [Terriglobales bacterium]
MPVVPSEQNPPLPEIKRLVNVISDPSATFGDLPRASRWWSPWLVVSAASLIFVVLLGQRVGFEQISANQIAISSRAEQFDKLPADQRQQALARSAVIVRVVSYASPITLLIVYAITAGILLGVFNAGMGAQLKFPTMLAIVSYSSLVHLIGTVLAIVLLVAPGLEPDKYNVANPSGTNIAYYLDPATTNKFLYALLSGVDAIVIWSIVLMGIGVATVSKVKRPTAIVTIAALYLGWKLLTGAMAAAF